MGSLNMILATHRDIVTEKPDMLQLVVKLQKQASEYAMAHPDEMVAMTISQKLGQKKEAVAASVANVELNWQMTPHDAGQGEILCRAHAGDEADQGGARHEPR